MAYRLQVVSGHLQTGAVSINSKVESCTRSSMSRPPITTHVLDTALGRPASGLPIQLCQVGEDNTTWHIIGSGVTNSDGRCGPLITMEQLKPGTYRMHFDTATYFASQNNNQPFYPYAEVVFIIYDTTQHYHIPLLLSPYAYSTYRGS
ncbi:5-hydroxyisourate hydrolase-like [Halichondria panicea]|uniref:5-hydroxyisourate hydrolase-like n=1 Tax=Halichondria panicea TaxID=6063 RepID=UPI00312B528B